MRAPAVPLAILVAAALAWWLLQGTPPAPDTELGDAPDVGASGPALIGRAPLPADQTGHESAEPARGHEVVRGSVEDEDGRLLAGVAVHLERHVGPAFLDEAPGHWIETEAAGRPQPYRPQASTHTAGDGTFVFADLPHAGGGYRVRVVPQPPFVAATRHAGAPWGERFLRIVVGRGSALRLRVVDAAGTGVSALLSGWREREGDGWHPYVFEDVPTGADGRVTLGLPDGAFRLDVGVPGMGVRRGLRLETPQSREVLVSLALPGGARLAGRIADSAGAPVGGARVCATAAIGPDERLTCLATSASDGTYALDGLPAGDLQSLAVVAAGFLVVEDAGGGRALVAGAVTRVDVTLLRGGVLEGTVTDPAGRPVGGAQVQAQATPRREGLASEARALTGADGRYRLTEVPLGAGRVRVAAPLLYQPASPPGEYVIGAERERAVVDVVMARGIAVVGRVVDEDGRPVAQAEVVASGRASEGWWWGAHAASHVTTDAHGDFAFPGLPPSRAWSLTARTAAALSLPVVVTTAADEEPPAPATIVLRPGAAIEGRVPVPEGETPGLLRVHATTRTGGFQTVVVRTEGTFRLEGLLPGDYEVRVVDWNLDAVSETARVTLTWGQVRRDLVLALFGWGRIAGTVVDTGGEPVPGRRLVLDVSTPSGDRRLTAETNGQGRFVFDTVPAGESGFALTLDGVRQPGLHRAGDTGIRLVYVRPEILRFEGTAHLPDGTPAVAGHVDLWEVTPDGGRTGRTLPIVQGTFGGTLERRGPDSTFSAEVREVFDERGALVDVRPQVIDPVEPEAPIAFRLVAGLDIRGVVLDDGGAPVAGVGVSLAPVGESLTWRHKNMATRGDGSFEFGALGEGAFEVRVTQAPAPWIPPPVLRANAGDADVRVRLLRGASIHGIVRGPDGRPLAGASVSWMPASGRSVATLGGQDGRFDLFPIPPGATGTLRALPPAGLQDVVVGATRADVRASAEAIEVRLGPGALIEGEVTGPDGESLPDAWVQCEAVAAGGRGTTSARLVDGTHLRLGPLPPGRYRLTVQAGAGYLAPGALEVEAPAEGLRIVVPRGLSVQGTLAGAERLERFSVGFTILTPEGPVTWGGTVTASGQFQLTLPSDASGTLYAGDREGGDLYALVEGVRAPATSLTVGLQAGATIGGRIAEYREGDEGHVYAQAASGVTLNGAVAPDGTFVVHGVPPGAYELRGFSRRAPLVTLTGVRAGTAGHLLRRP